MVIINLVSNLDEIFDVEKFYSYNHVIAYSLRRALLSLGHEINMVRDHGDEAPQADHTIVISAVAMAKVRDNPEYKAMLREATQGILALWLDASFSGWDQHFDRILNVVPPYKDSSDKYRWVGYAAYPDLFYPDQEEKTVFVDSYPWKWYGGAHDWIYRCIQEALAESGLRILQPIKAYNQGRAMWPEMIEAFRASHFHVTTQIGNFGLTNIEAITCGARLVLHEDLNERRSWPFLMPHALWETKEELLEILAREPDVDYVRSQALEHTWDKVVRRVLENLK